MLNALLQQGKIVYANKLFVSGNYEDALELYQEVAEKTAIKRCFLYAASLSGISTILREYKDFQEALRYQMEALSVYEKIKNHTQKEIAIAIACDNINVIYQTIGDYDRALEYAERAKAIFEENNAIQHLGNFYNNLMCLYVYKGEIVKAINISALALQYAGTSHSIGNMQRTHGIAHNVAVILNENRSDLGKALRLSHEALGIHEKGFVVNDSVYGKALTHTSQIYQQFDSHQQTLELGLQALARSKKNNRKKHVETAEAYLNVGDCYLAMGNLLKALNYGYRALNIFLSCLEPGNTKIADTYHLLSSIYTTGDDYEKAIEYAHKAMIILQDAHGKNHPAVMEAYHLYSVISYCQKKYTKAFSYSEQILKVKLNNYGTEAFDLINNYFQTAILALLCDKPQFICYTKEMMEKLVIAPHSVIKVPQESLRLKYLRQIKQHISFCYSIALTNPNYFDSVSLYDFALKTSNINAEISYAHTRLFRNTINPQIKSITEKLDTLRKEYDTYIFNGIDADTVTCNLKKEIESAELELLRLLDDTDFENCIASVCTADVQKVINNDDVILEFGRFTWYADKQAYDQSSFHDRYYVFAVTKDMVQFIDIGECNAIDESIKSIIRCFNPQMLSEMKYLEYLKFLYKKLIAPIKDCLDNKKTICIIPDSTLYKLPFEILLDEKYVSLEEKVSSIIYLSSGREVLRSSGGGNPNEILIIANPQYELAVDENEDNAENIADSNIPHNNQPHNSRDTVNYLRADDINALPFTEIEANEVASLFPGKARLKTGGAATEYSLQADAAADVLHVSTHGFAYPPQDNEMQLTGFRDISDRGKILKNAENPLLRCGLLFSGVRNWLRGEDLPAYVGDGILSGNDVLSLNLSKYKLMVLSACQTGLGDTQSGEGVKGLRRAFELAGVGTLVCTLWNVDDFTSALLMKRFYEELLYSHNITVSHALLNAKKYVREIDADKIIEMGWDKNLEDMKTSEDPFVRQAAKNAVLSLMTDDKPFYHPYFWAGYIVQGR